MLKRLRGRALQARRAAWFAEHPLCAECLKQGRTTLGAQLDHITPLHQGGTDAPTNWQTLCPDCHKRKSVTERGMTYRPTIGRDGWPVDG